MTNQLVTVFGGSGFLGRYVARLDHYCRSAPYNWFNFYELWS